MGETIEIQTADGPAQAYLARADDGASHPGVLLYIDAIGLRPRIEEMADRIAGWGHVVLAPNVFHRSGRAEDLAPTGDLTDPGEREAFMASGVMDRVQALTPDLSGPDAEAWLNTLREHATGPFGVIGYCMGARLAVRTAAQFPEEVAACGGFHGGGLVTEALNSPHQLLGDVRAELVFGHADQDRSMPVDAVAVLGEALAAAGLTHSNEIYEGAAHGYSMADTSTYDEAATERHFSALEELFARALRDRG